MANRKPLTVIMTGTWVQVKVLKTKDFFEPVDERIILDVTIEYLPFTAEVVDELYATVSPIKNFPTALLDAPTDMW